MDYKEIVEDRAALRKHIVELEKEGGMLAHINLDIYKERKKLRTALAQYSDEKNWIKEEHVEYEDNELRRTVYRYCWVGPTNGKELARNALEENKE